ncbi:MAG: hypothetical protein IPH13_19655 [Planctomycetes bacterium]|nr:hypothetical protein [Planctomycetota bacterium]MCC7169471.1 hypothetical protein [Planctomycetota bacterium]
MSNARERWMAAAIFAVVTLAFLAEGIPSGKAPVCVDALYRNPQEVPYSGIRPTEFVAHNPFLSDQALVFYPWLKFMREAVADGELPLWSPHPAGGLPFIANLSSAFFFPTTWLSFVPWWETGRGMFFAACLKLFVAGLFGFLFARRVGLSIWPALACGLVFELNGYMVVWLSYSLSNVASCLPLCLWATSRFCATPTPRAVALLAATMALQFLGGHAETSLALAIATTAYVVARPAGELTALSTLLPRYAIAGVAAVALCAFQLAPFVEYLNLSHGKVERLTSVHPVPMGRDPLSAPSLVLLLLSWASIAWGLRSATRVAAHGAAPRKAWWTLPLLGVGVAGLWAFGLRDRVVLLLDPDAYGSALHGCSYDGPEAYPDVNGGYVGVLAVGFGVLAFIASERRRLVGFAASLVGFAWLLAAQIQPLAAWLERIPPFDLAADTRMLPLACVGFGVLVAVALHDLWNGHASRYRRAVIALCIAFSPLVAIALLGADARRAIREGDPPAEWVASSDPRVVLDPRTTDTTVSCARIADGLPLQPVVRVIGRVPLGTRRVDLEVGGARVAAWDASKIAADGTFDVEWNAGRIERAAYVVRLSAGLADGSQAVSAPAVLRLARVSNSSLAQRPRTWVVVGVAVLLLAFGTSALRRIVVIVGAITVGVELFAFGAPYNTFVPEAWIYPPTRISSFLDAFAQQTLASGDGPVRVHGENLILQPNAQYAYDLQTIRSYDQLESAQFVKYMKQLTSDAPFSQWSSHTVDYASALFRRLNVRFVISAEPLDELAGLERTSIHDDHGWLYRVPTALPRATVVARAVDVKTTPIADLFELARRDDVAFLEVPPPRLDASVGSVRFAEYALNRVRLDVETDGSALVLLADNDFPGWTATVRGVSVPILRSHATFRAVEVPAGKSEVEFRYRPRSFTVGLVAAGLAALALGVWIRRGRTTLEKP